MNVEVVPLKTAAETALAQEFAQARGRLPGDKAIAAQRAAAFDVFARQGLPHRRVEEWKYTDLRALMRDAKPLAAPPDAKARANAKTAGALVGDVETRRLVFVDGAFVPELSDTRTWKRGFRSVRSPMLWPPAIRILADASRQACTGDRCRGGAQYRADGRWRSDPRCRRLDDRSADPSAFRRHRTKPAATFTRSLVVVEKGARAMLIESHEGPAGSDYQVNAAVEIFVGDEAHVDHVKLIGEGAEALHVSTLAAAIGAHARFNTFTFTAGGAVVRNQLFLKFDGEDTVAGIRGATLLKGKQHADSTLVVNHNAPGCQSREMFKAVLDDEAHGVFQGQIIVRPGAQKTDAKMMTQGLLLSERAEMDHKPELEIYADDVQCGHGATAGALDDELKFYLMARGIPAAEAEALLIQAFLGEAIEGIEHAGLREALMDSVVTWLKARG